jgi:hypothetical protein
MQRVFVCRRRRCAAHPTQRALPLVVISAQVFAGAFSALVVMTVLSALIGFALPNLLPKQYTHYAAAILFLYFGCVPPGLVAAHLCACLPVCLCSCASCCRDGLPARYCLTVGTGTWSQ